ncbi:sortase, partial [Clostridium perfringens]
IDQLKEGDFFYINIFGERLAYKVDEINIVKPNDTSKINISPNKDYVTLLTCYPYGINTERLLVRGERIFQKDTNSNKVDNSVNDINKNRYINKKLIIISLVLIIFSVLVIILKRKIKN